MNGDHANTCKEERKGNSGGRDQRQSYIPARPFTSSALSLVASSGLYLRIVTIMGENATDMDGRDREGLGSLPLRSRGRTRHRMR